MLCIMFQFLEIKPDTPIRITSQFNITEENIIMFNLCYIKDNLVAAMHILRQITCKAKVYDETSNTVKEWAPCHALCSMMEFEKYLLVGCTICEMILGYEFPEFQKRIFREGISPNAMCKGPDGTILVFDNTQKSLNQLRFYDGQFFLAKEFSVERVDVHSLCFSQNCDFVIALHFDRKTLTGFHFPSGQIAWRHTEIQLGSLPQVLTGFQSILVLPDGRVCIFTEMEIFVLNPVDGTILSTLHHFQNPGTIIATTTCCNGHLQKLGICTHPKTVSVYDVPFEPAEGRSFLPWKDIVCDEETFSG